MPMHNFYALSYHNIAEYREEGKYGRERRLAVDDEEGDVVDFETIGEVADTSAAFVGMGYNDDLVATVDEFGGELVDVRFDAAGLGEEEVGDHGDVIGHFEELRGIVATRYAVLSINLFLAHKAKTSASFFSHLWPLNGKLKTNNVMSVKAAASDAK